MGRSKVKVLFVCLGNICRSPLAEGIFKGKINEYDLSTLLEVDSCGTSNYHIGEQPDGRTVENAKTNGLVLRHKARQFVAQDFLDFDYIIPMDCSNLTIVERLRPKGAKAQVHLIRSYEPKITNMNVPDPYYGGPDGFQEVYDILEIATEGLIQVIIEEKLRV